MTGDVLGQRRTLITIGSVVVSLVLLIAIIAGYRTIRADQPIIISFTAPAYYSGWLVVSWNCASGDHLSNHSVGGRRYSLAFSQQGTICLADNVPSEGYDVSGYQFGDPPRQEAVPSGQPTPSPNPNASRQATPFLRTLPHKVDPGDPGNTTLDPAIGASSNHHYDVAWVEFRDRTRTSGQDLSIPQDQLHLGDQCNLVQFLQQQFGEPPVTVPCGIVPTRVNAHLTN